MAYDIYGNNLRPGHCEVHPHVHEEYPCSLCLMEKELQKAREIIQQMDKRINSLEYQMGITKTRLPLNPYDLDSVARDWG